MQNFGVDSLTRIASKKPHEYNIILYYTLCVLQLL